MLADMFHSGFLSMLYRRAVVEESAVQFLSCSRPAGS